MIAPVDKGLFNDALTCQALHTAARACVESASREYSNMQQRLHIALEALRAVTGGGNHVFLHGGKLYALDHMSLYELKLVQVGE